MSRVQRDGFTLLEVLISGVVVSIGVLGVATLIPMAQFQIQAANRADMAANFGRAALKEIVAQGWMYQFDGLEGTTSPTTSESTSYGAYWFNWNGTRNDPDASDFWCSDDLQLNESQMSDTSPLPFYDTSLRGRFEWVGTVCKLTNEYYEVSAAVCFRRTDVTSLVLNVTSAEESLGRVQIAGTAGTLTEQNTLARGEYIYLSTGTKGHWYKIISVTNDDGVLYLDLDGPEWTYSRTGLTAYTPGHVIAAYTEIIPAGLR